MSLPDGVAGGVARRRRGRGIARVRLGFAPRLRRRRRLRHGRGETLGDGVPRATPQTQRRDARRLGNDRSGRREGIFLRAAAAAPTPTSAPAAAAAAASASTARGGFLDAREEPPALRVVGVGVRRLGALGDGPERLRGLERLRRALHARRARVPRVQGADQAGDVPERREVAHRQERLGEVLQHERIPRVHGESHLQRVAREMRHAPARGERAQRAPQPRVRSVDLHRRGVAPQRQAVGLVLVDGGAAAGPGRRRRRGSGVFSCFRHEALEARVPLARAVRGGGRGEGLPARLRLVRQVRHEPAEVLQGQELDLGHRGRERDRRAPHLPTQGGDGPVRRGLRHHGVL